ncbi:MAG TPA: DegT/DnrJ/EryC1/StrS family aminotransferase [Pseudolabrys sp.]|jgi:dTDP-4-amino-4,6-dideoxygalactose transaminase|nr:DegT/DnrJ/EryC1/StrS family aminotransferase [Pseudolabrys sp.]
MVAEPLIHEFPPHSSPARKETIEVPFAMPDIGEAEIEAVVECLRSGWITTGEKNSRFERDFAQFIGGGIEAIAVSSCTEGLQIALAALGIGPGDEVITTDLTFSATAMSIIHVGARPVLVDIDPITLNIDVCKIEAAITSRTKAIIPVHYAGLACNMDAIQDIARRRNLKVIEDAAHSFPATWRGKMIGQNTSDATVFSFYATKTITTGEGGMITVADPAVAKRIRTLRLHGIDRDAFDRYRSASASWQYEIVAPGFKSNLTDIAAAIGIVQLGRAWELQKRRSYLSNRYTEQFASLPLTAPPAAPEGDVHAFHLYPVRLRDGAPIDRDSFILEMRKKGINCSVHFIPLHCHAYWKRTLSVTAEQFPQTQKAYERLVTLPLFTKMSDRMQQHVIDSTTELLS